MFTRLLTCSTLLIGLGILTPIIADPTLKAEGVAQGLLGKNPGRHLALGHYKQNPSLALPEIHNSAFSNTYIGDVRIHGYRESTPAGVVAVPEPGAMFLLGSGLVGLAAAIRKRRGAHN